MTASQGLADHCPAPLFNIYAKSIHTNMLRNIKLIEHAEDFIMLIQGNNINKMVMTQIKHFPN